MCNNYYTFTSLCRPSLNHLHFFCPIVVTSNTAAPTSSVKNILSTTQLTSKALQLSSTAGLTTSSGNVTHLQPTLLSSIASLTTSSRNFSMTHLQPTLTSKAPQLSTYIYTVLPSIPHYMPKKPTTQGIQPSKALVASYLSTMHILTHDKPCSTLPELASSTTSTSSTNSKHTAILQTASLPMRTPTGSLPPIDPQPIAGRGLCPYLTHS